MRVLDLSADLTNLFIENIYSQIRADMRGDSEIFNCLVIRHTYCCIVTYLVIQSSILKSNPSYNKVFIHKIIQVLFSSRSTQTMKAKLFVILGLIALPMVATIAMGSHRAMQQETTGQYVDSSVITLKVKSKLLADPDIKGLAISVMSYKGQVKLGGFANNWAQKQKAGMLAKQVEGVTGVTNNIVVKKMHR